MQHPLRLLSKRWPDRWMSQPLLMSDDVTYNQDPFSIFISWLVICQTALLVNRDGRKPVADQFHFFDVTPSFRSNEIRVSPTRPAHKQARKNQSLGGRGPASAHPENRRLAWQLIKKPGQNELGGLCLDRLAGFKDGPN